MGPYQIIPRRWNWRCSGVSHKGIPNVSVLLWFNFIEHYPASIHSDAIQEKFGKGNSGFMPSDISWTFTSDGTFKSLACNPIIVRDRKNKEQVQETTTRLGIPACKKYFDLQFNNRHLARVIQEAIAQDYNGNLPDGLCPPSIINKRINDARASNGKHRLNEFNNMKRINRLSRRADDHDQIGVGHFQPRQA